MSIANPSQTKEAAFLEDQANLFWSEFLIYEPSIKNYLNSRDPSTIHDINSIIGSIKKTLDIEHDIGLNFGIDTRNGLVLPERKDMFEIIISPMFVRKNKKLMHAIYLEGKSRLSSEWGLIKYKFWQPSSLESMKLSYVKKDIKPPNTNIVIVTKDDFSFYPIIDTPANGHSESLSKIDIILFIADDKMEYLVKKAKTEIAGKRRNIYIPADIGIYTILDAAIGEYNALNILDKMEIHPESVHPEIERKPIGDLLKFVKMASNNPLSVVKQCGRCKYSNLQTSLHACKCGKVYYCDKICQKACRPMHKVNCC